MLSALAAKHNTWAQSPESKRWGERTYSYKLAYGFHNTILALICTQHTYTHKINKLITTEFKISYIGLKKNSIGTNGNIVAIWFYFPMYNTQTTDIIVICLSHQIHKVKNRKISKKEHIQLTIKDNLCLTLSVYYKEETYH